MVPLFARSRRGLEPTGTGAAVLAHARLAMADTEALGRELAVIGAGLHGRLRIGVIPYVAPVVLDAACSHGLQQQPRVAVLVREGTTDELVAALRAHELDCVIARSFYAPGDDIVQTPLYREEPALVVPVAAAARLARGKLDWPRLAALDWIFAALAYADPPHHQYLVRHRRRGAADADGGDVFDQDHRHTDAQPATRHHHRAARGGCRTGGQRQRRGLAPYVDVGSAGGGRNVAAPYGTQASRCWRWCVRCSRRWGEKLKG
ncbi:LysR family transcriptional regulator [Cupriavidus basilensis]